MHKPGSFLRRRKSRSSSDGTPSEVGVSRSSVLKFFTGFTKLLSTPTTESQPAPTYTVDDWVDVDVHKLASMFNAGIPHFRLLIDRKQKAAFNERINHWGTGDDEDDLTDLLSGLTMQGYDNLDAGLKGHRRWSRIRESMVSWAENEMFRMDGTNKLHDDDPQSVLRSLEKCLGLQLTDRRSTNMQDACRRYGKTISRVFSTNLGDTARVHRNFEVGRIIDDDEEASNEAPSRTGTTFSYPRASNPDWINGPWRPRDSQPPVRRVAGDSKENSDELPPRTHMGSRSRLATTSAQPSSACSATETRDAQPSGVSATYQSGTTTSAQSSWAPWKIALGATAGVTALAWTAHKLYSSFKDE